MIEPFGWVDEAGKFIRRTDEPNAITCTGKLTAVYSEDQLAASQAREERLREVIKYEFGDAQFVPVPSDNSALDAAIRKGQREALEKAAEMVSAAKGQPGNDWGEGYTSATKDAVDGLRALAKELE